MNLLSPIIAAILGAIAAALDRTAARLRRWASALPRHHLPPARMISVGGRPYVMCDDLPYLIPINKEDR